MCVGCICLYTSEQKVSFIQALEPAFIIDIVVNSIAKCLFDFQRLFFYFSSL